MQKLDVSRNNERLRNKKTEMLIMLQTGTEQTDNGIVIMKIINLPLGID